jgi:hypothetical protein
MYNDVNGLRKKSVGRPEDPDVTEAFSDLINYIMASDKNPVPLKHLVKKMHVMCGENAYSSKYLKKKDS